MFGVTYRVAQYSAIVGVELIDVMNQESPFVVLANTEVKIDGGWARLDNAKAINDYVVDVAGALQPRYVLSILTSKVMDFNFGFLGTWKKIKVPSRFRSEIDMVEVASVRPMIATIIQEGLATMRELEEYYSVDDAFKMLDVITAKAVNSALAHEEAVERAKNS